MTSLIIQPLWSSVRGKPRSSVYGNLVPLSEGISDLCLREFCTLVPREYHDSLIQLHISYTPSRLRIYAWGRVFCIDQHLWI